jgi:hypothetical protein
MKIEIGSQSRDQCADALALMTPTRTALLSGKRPSRLGGDGQKTPIDAQDMPSKSARPAGMLRSGHKLSQIFFHAGPEPDSCAHVFIYQFSAQY